MTSTFTYSHVMLDRPHRHVDSPSSRDRSILQYLSSLFQETASLSLCSWRVQIGRSRRSLHEQHAVPYSVYSPHLPSTAAFRQPNFRGRGLAVDLSPPAVPSRTASAIQKATRHHQQ